MYVPEIKFEDVLKKHEGLLKQLTIKVQSSPKYRHCTFEELYSTMQLAAWGAWKAQVKNAKSNGGLSKYQFGTFMTYHIKLALRECKELQKSETVPFTSMHERKDNSFSDIFFLETQEQIHYILGKLPDIQRKVLQMRFYEDKTLRECGEVLDLTTERIRQIQESALGKVKTELCKT